MSACVTLLSAVMCMSLPESAGNINHLFVWLFEVQFCNIANTVSVAMIGKSLVVVMQEKLEKTEVKFCEKVTDWYFSVT